MTPSKLFPEVERLYPNSEFQLNSIFVPGKGQLSFTNAHRVPLVYVLQAAKDMGAKYVNLTIRTRHGEMIDSGGFTIARMLTG